MESRRDFLSGCGAGAAVVTGGYLGWKALNPPLPSAGQVSFAEAGEDCLVQFIFQELASLARLRGKSQPIELKSYLDVGAYDPIRASNTYYFYLRGARGVLVEPNVDLIPRLRSVRPDDEVLHAGIGAGGQAAEADFYVMNVAARGTFSKEEAEKIEKDTQHLGKNKIFIKQVVKVPLLNINELMAKHFGGAPSFINIDTEGFDIYIVRSFDFTKFRPEVLCIETIVTPTTKVNQAILDHRKNHGYVARAATFQNTIFVDGKLLDE